MSDSISSIIIIIAVISFIFIILYFLLEKLKNQLRRSKNKKIAKKEITNFYKKNPKTAQNSELEYEKNALSTSNLKKDEYDVNLEINFDEVEINMKPDFKKDIVNKKEAQQN